MEGGRSPWDCVRRRQGEDWPVGQDVHLTSAAPSLPPLRIAGGCPGSMPRNNHQGDMDKFSHVSGPSLLIYNIGRLGV